MHKSTSDFLGLFAEFEAWQQAAADSFWRLETSEISMDRREHLQVKIMSLAAEARIIKKKERALKKYGPLQGDRAVRFHSLQDHRRGIVRSEARHSLLAYACIREMAYGRVENKCRTRPDWKRVESLVAKFMSPYEHYISPEIKKIAEERVKMWAKSTG